MSVDPAKCVELLQAMSSQDNQARQAAEKLYAGVKVTEPDAIAMGFLSVIVDTTVSEECRTRGCVLLRQMVAFGAEKDWVWARMSAANRQDMAMKLVQAFEREPTGKIQRKIGNVIDKLSETVCDTDEPKGWIAPGQCGWPGLLEVIFRMANPATTTNRGTCENAIRLLKALVSHMTKQIVGAQAELGTVIQNALACEDMNVKVAAFLFICEIVEQVEKRAWAPLVATGAVLTQVLEQLVASGNSELLEECLKELEEVVKVEPDFFKQNLSTNMQPAKFMSTLIKTNDGSVDGGIRGLCLEWLVSYCERKPKWLAKSLKDFPALTLECCMDMMLEVDKEEDEIKAWMARMDDEEGEEDADEIFRAGEESIDRVVKAMQEAAGLESVSQPLFALIGRYGTQTPEENWQARHAALAAIKQTVEYIDEREHTNEMAKLLIAHMDHFHPRVRYTALHAMGQLANDQAPHFQEEWHQMVMPLLKKKMDDQVDRVAAMAMSAFVSFGEELDKTLMAGYANEFMTKLVTRLQTTQHRMVTEESITSIAVIAGVIEKEFSQYYDTIMPLMKQLVLNAKGEKENRLRGKAFECMSLLGLAVGKEKFLPDANQAITAMMSSPLEADDVQREYVKEAAERICKCLKGDFKQFLPHLLPGIFASFKISAETGAEDDDDDEEYIQMMSGEGKLIKVKSSKLEELSQSLQLLQTFCTEMEGAYVEWVQGTAEALVPLINTDNPESNLYDDARAQAYQVWALLIKCAKDAQGANTGVAAQLLQTLIQRALQSMAEDTDPESLRDAADGVGEGIKNCGPGVLSHQEIFQLVEQFFKFIDESFKRTQKNNEEKKASDAGAPPDLQQDEDESDDEETQEDNCRQTMVEALGHIMEVGPNEFLQCLPACQQKIMAWLQTKEYRVLALFLGCELLKNLKDKSEPVWQVLMPAVLQSITSQDPEERIPACYAVNLAAPLQRFSEAAAEAFRRLAQVVGGAAPKRSQERAKVALDNATSALLALTVSQGAHCPPDIKAWSLIVARLPIRDDEEEAKKVHSQLVTLLLQENAGLLENGAMHLGKVLSTLAEVYTSEELCTKETDVQIQQIFTRLPRESLVNLGSNFSEKQQKKIERMLTEAAS